MRLVLGPLVFDALLLAAGEALLVGLGLVRRRRDALVWAGLAFVLGWGVVGALVSLALMLGASAALWQACVLALVVVAAGVGLARLVPAAPVPAPPPEEPRFRFAGRLAAGALALYVGLLGVHAAVAGAPTQWDAWAFWIPKARAIVSFGGLHAHLVGGYASFAHPEYPPLVPALDAVVFRFAGSTDIVTLPFQDWLLATAFLAAVAALLARRVPGVVLWPALLFVALAPGFGRFLGSGLGDPPLARLFALAAVVAALWLLEREPRLLALLGLLLGAAAFVKGEGMLLGLVLLLALGLATALERGPVRPVAALLAVPILASVPWQLWLHAEHVRATPDYRLGDVLRLGYLAHRIDRLGTALGRLPGYALSPHTWLLLVPVALVLALCLLRRARGLAVLVLVLVGGGYLGLASVYWISTLPLGTYIETSAGRVTISLVLVCGVLAPLLAAELMREDAPE